MNAPPIDLSQSPAPDIVETINFESLLAERKAKAVSLYPADGHAAVAEELAFEGAAVSHNRTRYRATERHAAAAGKRVCDGLASRDRGRHCNEDWQPHVPRNRHHCVLEKRRHAGERRGDCEPRFDAYDSALRQTSRRNPLGRGRADPRVTGHPKEIGFAHTSRLVDTRLECRDRPRTASGVMKLFGGLHSRRRGGTFPKLTRLRFQRLDLHPTFDRVATVLRVPLDHGLPGRSGCYRTNCKIVRFQTREYLWILLPIQFN